jgi:hypothetical protein
MFDSSAIGYCRLAIAAPSDLFRAQLHPHPALPVRPISPILPIFPIPPIHPRLISDFRFPAFCFLILLSLPSLPSLPPLKNPPALPNLGMTLVPVRIATIKSLNLCRRLLFGCKWTPRAAQVAALARKEAAALNHDSVQEIHFTIALGHLGVGLPAERLKQIDFQYDRAMAQARTILGTGTHTLESTAIPFGPGVKRIIRVAKKLSLRDGLFYMGIEHLFLALLREPEQFLFQLIDAKGFTLENFRAETERIYHEALDLNIQLWNLK